jgi:hypothetical protein
VVHYYVAGGLAFTKADVVPPAYTFLSHISRASTKFAVDLAEYHGFEWLGLK